MTTFLLEAKAAACRGRAVTNVALLMSREHQRARTRRSIGPMHGSRVCFPTVRDPTRKPDLSARSARRAHIRSFAAPPPSSQRRVRRSRLARRSASRRSAAKNASACAQSSRWASSALKSRRRKRSRGFRRSSASGAFSRARRRGGALSTRSILARALTVGPMRCALFGPRMRRPPPRGVGAAQVRHLREEVPFRGHQHHQPAEEPRIEHDAPLRAQLVQAPPAADAASGPGEMRSPSRQCHHRSGC